MNVILVIWTVVGFAGTQFSTHAERDWRPIGRLESPSACHNAAKSLNLKAGQYRCIHTLTGQSL